MEKLKNNYIKKGQDILSRNESLATESFGFFESFTRTKLKRFKGNIAEYYTNLGALDSYYTSLFKTSGAINDLNMLNAQLQVISKAREMYTSALSAYEKELANIEGSLNFRLTTIIAIVAIIVSVASIA